MRTISTSRGHVSYVCVGTILISGVVLAGSKVLDTYCGFVNSLLQISLTCVAHEKFDIHAMLKQGSKEGELLRGWYHDHPTALAEEVDAHNVGELVGFEENGDPKGGLRGGMEFRRRGRHGGE